jgi:hypothetical protein
MNLLIPYRYFYDHSDPLLNEFTYGDIGTRARKLKNDLKKCDYVFFHTGINGKKYITAYYVVDRVVDTINVIKDRNITAKYKNPHISDVMSGKAISTDDDVLLFGDPIESRVLEKPLLFDIDLAKRLSLGITFPKDRTETQAIGSATRAWRKLKESDVNMLLAAIDSSEKDAKSIQTVLSTDEVTEVIEKDIEGFIEKNPTLIGKSLVLKGRQLDTPVGRLDLLFEDKSGNPIVVELKLNKIGREAINQIRRYMKWIEKETKKDTAGIIVCTGVMPAFEEDFKKLNKIKIFCYGWKLTVQPWVNNGT